MKETISLHIGQTGVQIGDSCWKLYCLEHGVQPDGQSISNTQPILVDDILTLFSETEASKYVPRALFIDSCQTSIDKVQNGNNQLFQSEQFITNDGEDPSNTYSKGYNSIGQNLLERTLDQIRKLAEESSYLDNFMLFHSFGGGTGSGFFSLLLEHLSSEYSKNKKIEFSIFPDEKYSNSVFEPYNTVLSFSESVNLSDRCFLFDNESLYDICHKKLQIKKPTYSNLNNVLCQAISSITYPLRFIDLCVPQQVDFFDRFMAHYERFHYFVCSYAGFLSSECSCAPFDVSVLTDLIFDDKNMMFRCNPYDGKFLRCSALYRGDVFFKSAISSIDKIINEKNFNFIDCIEEKIRLSFDYIRPRVIPGGELHPFQKAACMVTNNTAITESLNKIVDKFDQMYEKQEYVNLYFDEGMEKTEFNVARENIASLKEEISDLED